MKIQIKHRDGTTVLFETDAETIGAAVAAAIAVKANLSYADLSSADLSSADLSSADLSSADLSSADLSYANLSYANLRSADLRYADLRYADLRYANLRYANLSYANLSYANLRSADLSSAKINAKELTALLTTRTILPDGNLVAWKKLQDGTICKLLIPAKAKRVGGLIGRKCRAEYAKVISGAGVGEHDGKTKYIVGKIVKPDRFDPNPLVECSNGIHFYITKQEAEAHS